MKYASLILSAIALLLSIYLLATRPGSGAASAHNASQVDGLDDTPNIVFVYADTVFTQYKEFADQQAALEKRQREAEQSLQQKGAALESEVRKVQQKMQQGLLAPNQIADEEQRIGRQQQQLMAEREQIGQSLMQESQILTDSLQGKIRRTLAEIREEFGYDYILSYGPGTGVIMVDDEYNITAELVSRLNATAPAMPATTPAAEEEKKEN